MMHFLKLLEHSEVEIEFLNIISRLTIIFMRFTRSLILFFVVASEHFALKYVNHKTV